MSFRWCARPSRERHGMIVLAASLALLSHVSVLHNILSNIIIKIIICSMCTVQAILDHPLFQWPVIRSSVFSVSKFKLFPFSGRRRSRRDGRRRNPWDVSCGLWCGVSSRRTARTVGRKCRSWRASRPCASSHGWSDDRCVRMPDGRCGTKSKITKKKINMHFNARLTKIHYWINAKHTVAVNCCNFIYPQEPILMKQRDKLSRICFYTTAILSANCIS